MKVAERLYYFIKHNKLSLSDFDKSIGTANGYIGKQIKKNGSIGSHIIENIIATYPSLNVVWLLTGNESMINTIMAPDGAIDASISSQQSSLALVNLQPDTLKAIAETFDLTKQGGHLNEGAYSMDKEKNTLVNVLPRDSFLCVKYRGEAKHPTIKNGSYLIIQNLSQLELNNSNQHDVIIVYSITGIHIGQYEIDASLNEISIYSLHQEKHTYADRKIKFNEIVSVWRVIQALSPDFKMDKIPKDRSVSTSDSIEEQLRILENSLEKLKIDIAKKNSLSENQL